MGGGITVGAHKKGKVIDIYRNSEFLFGIAKPALFIKDLPITMGQVFLF